MRLPEQAKLVTAFVPVDINSTGVSGDYVSMKLYDHVSIIVQAGVIGAAATISVYKATDISGTGATLFSADNWYTIGTNSSDTLTKGTAASTIGTGTTDNQMRLIEIDAEELGDYDCVQVRMSDPGDPTVVSGLYLLQKPRYKGAAMPSAITD